MSIAQLSVDRPTRREARRASPGLTLAVILTAAVMFIMDVTVVNIALPTIQGALHFSATGLSWVLNAYTLAFGGFLLLGGRAGDILGRRRVFMAGLLVFTLSSLLGGLAPTAGWLLAARGAQGIGAAFAGPSVLVLIATNFAEGSPRNRALALYSAVVSAGSSLGLILGGILTASASWRWVMFINVPIGLAVVALAPLVIQEPARRPARLDIVGALTATGGMTTLVYGFIRAASDGWGDRLTLSAFAAAAILLLLFLAVEVRIEQPIVPLRLLADRNRASAYLNMLLLPATMFGAFFFLTQFIQDVLGFSPLQAGVAFLPLTLVMFATVQVVPRVLPRVGPKPILIVGATLVTGANVWLTQISATSAYAASLVGPMALLGVGIGCSFLPLQLLILSGVARHESGSAAGLLQTMQQVGGSLGLAILVTVFGGASREAATHPLAAVSRQAQAHHIFAQGVASAFSVGTCFAIGTLLVALFAISATPSGQPSQYD